MAETAAKEPTGARSPLGPSLAPGRVVVNWFRELTLVPVIVVLMIVGWLANPIFLTGSNLVNVAQTAAAVGVVVVAESLILLTGKFDLSLQGTFGLAPLLGAWLVAPHKQGGGIGTEWSPFAGLLVALLVAAAIGTFNGILVIKAGFNAFIFTLAMMILLSGLQLGLVGGATIYRLPHAFVYIGSDSWFGVPVSVWLTALTFLGFGLFLRYHRAGRAIYAIGGNVEAARAAGIKVDRVRIAVFAVASVLAAIGGLMESGQLTAVTAGQGSNLIFGVFAAAVIGGVSLDGGRGRMLGALTGVILLQLVVNILVLTNIPSYWISAVDGVIILIALALARVIGRDRA
jgi:simple sugar transport system permease protein